MIRIEIRKLGEATFTDRTSQIKNYTLTLGATKEASTGRFFVNAYGIKYVPSGEDEVIFFDGTKRIFSGFIVRVSQSVQQGAVIVYECDLKDRVHILDRLLVNISRTNIIARNLIVEIVSLFSGPGITTNNVANNPADVIASISFNNIPVSEAIQQIADLFGNEWFIDENSDIHFFSKLTMVAPFDITDTNGKAIFESIEIVKDYTQIRNSILVEGGDGLSTAIESDRFLGDGQTNSFTLSRKYTDISVLVNGVSQTVGIANIHTFATHNVLYNFSLRSVQFNPNTPPTNGHIIVVSGRYYFPTMVRFRNRESMDIHGEKQFFIQDRNIITRTDAINRASAEISAYSRSISEGSFETYESGLRPGQRITINSSLRGVNEPFVIQRVSGSYHTPEKLKWRVEIVSIKSFELIDLLAEIIRGRRKESDPNVVVGIVADTLVRRLRVNRFSVNYFNSPPTWVVGYFAPPNLADRRRPAFTNRTCLLPI